MPGKGGVRAGAGTARPLRLSVTVPESDTEPFLVAMGLARQAPIFETFGAGADRSYRATFTDMTRSLDVVIRLIGEASRCRGGRATIDDQEIASLPRFWSALICYQESLAEADPRKHCLRVSTRLNHAGGCPDESCASPCQFLCTRCLDLSSGKGGTSVKTRLKELARQAEVAWCPNLGLPDRLPVSHAPRIS
jgi:hypothetical protein